MPSHYNTIIFDLGAVLIDWNPRYVYKQIFVTDDATEYFFNEICTNSWNEQQDAGYPFAQATADKIKEYPHYKSEIEAYYGRWEEMLGEAIIETVDILAQLKQSGQFTLLALTNWSAESFPVALRKFDFLQWFDGILVSGQEGLKKPDPAIFELLLSRYNVDRKQAIFIDDNLKNITSANQLGIESIHFTDSDSCKTQLNKLLGNILD